MRTIIIVQARLGSTRLPGKITLPIGGRALLEHTLMRLLTLSHPIILAVPDSDNRDFYNSLIKKHPVELFYGSEHNVLERFYQAACAFNGELIVRITGDCPLVQPSLLADMIHFFEQSYDKYDYISNVITRSYPKGMDLELFRFDALERVYHTNTCSYTKEHVTPSFYKKGSPYRLYNFKQPKDLSGFNVSIDTKADLERVEALIDKYGKMNPYFELSEMDEALL